MKRIKFIQIKETTYLQESDRAKCCPIPQQYSCTFEMIRTPMQVLHHLAGRANYLGSKKPCWLDCELECPARDKLEKALTATLAK